MSLLHELIQDYRNFHGALEIHAFPDSTYQLQAKHNVMIEPGVARFTRGKNLPPPKCNSSPLLPLTNPLLWKI